MYLYYQTPGQHTSAITAFYDLQLTPAAQGWVFWAFFVAFAIKMPLFPFHTWQPDTYTESPTPATMLLAGIMLKMGVYGLIRLLLPIVPLALNEWGAVAIVLSVIGIVYGSIIAIQQRDMKRLIAYSSFAHVGLMAAGSIFGYSQWIAGRPDSDAGARHQCSGDVLYHRYYFSAVPILATWIIWEELPRKPPA